MQNYIFVIVGLLAIAFIFKMLSEKDAVPNVEKSDSFEKLLYKPRHFLTQSELRFFRTLEEKYGNDYYIVPQVLLSSIVDVDLPKKFYAYKGYRSKIDKKTLDFVLFDKVSFMPVLAIELDDYTHQREDRKERDSFVNALMEKVGIKLDRQVSGINYNSNL